MSNHVSSGRLDTPTDVRLPFFSYGIFQPGQLAFLRIRDFVSKVVKAETSGRLFYRDGLLLLADQGNEKCEGHLVFFRDGDSKRAYDAVSEMEPAKHYQWYKKSTNFLEAEVLQPSRPANLLVGRVVDYGTDPYSDEIAWGRSDPYFNEAFELIEAFIRRLKRSTKETWPARETLELNMYYMLIWSAVERFCTFRYVSHSQDDSSDNRDISHANVGVMTKIRRLATDKTFCEELTKNGEQWLWKQICSSSDPRDRITWDKNRPQKMIDFLYQIRSNSTHTGKAAISDRARLLKALEILSRAFKTTVDSAFEAAQWEGENASGP